MTKANPSVVCIGAGPAGLTAAYLLSKQGIAATVLEQDPVYVGGISRTARYKGFSFDIGGHRFFSKSAEVNALWSELLSNDFLDRPRKSRIYYRSQLFDYPLKAFDALSKLGVIEAIRCVLSYLKVKVRPLPETRTFEQWVTNRFGRRLFEIFFKTYTEKVWGMTARRRPSRIGSNVSKTRPDATSANSGAGTARRERRRSRRAENTIPSRGPTRWI